MKKSILLLTLTMLVFFTLTGCMGGETSSQTENTSSTASTSGNIDTTTSTNKSSSSAESSANGDEDLDDIEADYSDKDKDSTYDEEESTVIVLSDSGTEITGSGAEANNGTITISETGTYILSGTLSDGQILINTSKDDTIHLILNGISLTNSTGCALYVEQAEKVIVTLADGSQNTVSDSASYSLTGEEDPDAAIYAGDDLTFNGTGTLTVSGNYKHAIKTVDDLVIIDGTYYITSVEEGLRGKDSISIAGGVFNINASGDAIKSNNDEDEDSGWIAIEGGTYTITAQNNGIESEKSLVISGGEFDITSAGDTLHSNSSIRISGGTMTLAASDDGIHADNTLEITGGEVNITQSYEGLEGSEVIISGGMVFAYASDDGINAAGGSDGDMRSGDKFRSSSSGDYIVSICGGYTYINASGDGVDSNGDIEITGGTLVVDGPTSSSNSAMDQENCDYIVSGGTLVAAGSSGMLITPSDAEQVVITIIFGSTQQAESTFAIADSDGNIIMSISPAKNYQSLQLSSPEFIKGDTYTLMTGGTISGESYDGSYYMTTETYADSSGSYDFEVTALNMRITATSSSSGTGGSRGGGRGH